MSNQKIKRFTIQISEAHADELAVLAKRYKLSQGEIIEVLLDNLNPRTVGESATRRREEKVNARTSIHAITQRLRKERKAEK